MIEIYLLFLIKINTQIVLESTHNTLLPQNKKVPSGTFCYIRYYQSGSIALTGQTYVHPPHESQRSGSILYPFHSRLMASSGHTNSHLPHFMQLLCISYGITRPPSGSESSLFTRSFYHQRSSLRTVLSPGMKKAAPQDGLDVAFAISVISLLR